MGNSDGNITVETERPASGDMSKLNDISKLLFFPHRDEKPAKFLPSNFTDKPRSTSPFFTTKVRGQLIAFPAQTFSKVSEVVDLRVEKSNSEVDETFSPKASPKPQQSDSAKCSASKLKFGIDSILSSSSKSGQKNTALMSADSQEKCLTHDSVSPKLAVSPNPEVSKPSSFHHLVKTVPQNCGKLNKASMPISRNSHEIRHHPYSKSTIERSQSDPAWSPEIRPQIRLRRRSESPPRSAFLFSKQSRNLSSTVSDINSKRLEENRIRANPEPTRIDSSSLSKPSSLPIDNFHHSLKKPMPISQSLPKSNPFKISESVQRVLETDEVFKESSEYSKKNLAAKNFEQFLKQRNYLASSPNSGPSSPMSSSPLEKTKFGPIGYFPNINQPHMAPFNNLTPSNFNFQAWQNLPSNCHPTMFRHLLNPYMYNQTAAAAAALSYFQSLKSAAHQGIMIPDGFRMSKTPPKSGFGFRSPDPEMHPNSDKHGSSKNKRRKWTRAVFSILQRRALEDSFKGQKYVAKPERRYLAERLGLTDAQVKIWFQNRRMKWRQEQKNKLSVGSEDMSPTSGEDNFRQFQTQT